VDARGPWLPSGGPPPLVPQPRPPAEPPLVRFVDTPQAARRVPRVAVMALVGLLLVGAFALGARWYASAHAYGPPAGREESRVPLGAPPPESAVDQGSHAFTQVQSDGTTPVAYDPCRPVHYVVRTAGAPDGGDALVATAVERVSAATGLQFVDDGATTEAPSARREAYQPHRYGKRWAPVLVTWSAADETPALDGDVAGLGGSAAVHRDGVDVYVTGSVTLDTDEITRLLQTPNGRAVALGVVTHEFGHLVGLDHVDDAAELMYPSTNLAVTSFAAGDREGLALLGQGRCTPDL